MQERKNALNNWIRNLFTNKPFTLTPLTGDASFRQYSRLHCDESSYVVMDAPPDKEAVAPFIHIARKLASIGIHTPNVVAVENTQGFVLLEDFGDQLLLNMLSLENVDRLYAAAITILFQLQQCSIDDKTIPNFDKTYMLKELSLFRDWFLQAHLSLPLLAQEESILNETFDWLTTEITQQPTVLIHRDFHSRNLMVINNDTVHLGVIDFQDAMYGPFTYDLVSLLKDCYIQWPRERVLEWMTYFYQQSPINDDWSLHEFTRAFDFCGLQRHLKVLGIFCRLHLRDHKSAYLQDLPLIINYVTSCAESYTELQPFYQFMQKRVIKLFIEKRNQ